MNFGIIGSGFGIYGWLSALNHFDEIKISTLASYKKKFLDRKDIENLSALGKSINWCENEELLFKSVDLLIIARRPIDQIKIINHLISQSWKGSLIIEKPIAPTPELSKKIIKKLLTNNINLQVGFSINETNWSRKVKELILKKKPKEISINWNFLADHYKYSKRTWKSNPIFGGGALSFYCIHLIAWLSSFSEWKVNSCSPLLSKTNDPNIIFKLSNESTNLEINCNSMNKNLNSFTVIEKSNRNELILNLENPFSEKTIKINIVKTDLRVPYLIKIVEKTVKDNWIDYSFLEKHIKLWENIKNKREIF